MGLAFEHLKMYIHTLLQNASILKWKASQTRSIPNVTLFTCKVTSGVKLAPIKNSPVFDVSPIHHLTNNTEKNAREGCIYILKIRFSPLHVKVCENLLLAVLPGRFALALVYSTLGNFFSAGSVCVWEPLLVTKGIWCFSVQCCHFPHSQFLCKNRLCCT